MIRRTVCTDCGKDDPAFCGKRWCALAKQLRRQEPCAVVKSAEGRAAGADVKGASVAMQSLAALAQKRAVSARNQEESR